uniref:Thioredoxin domain-containing protein n=1 Tax=viral metagenome TaxID=1070528 RepID=A0A6C0DAE1_9ZZZZ
MDSFQKYLKYKEKYLNLKNSLSLQNGGGTNKPELYLFKAEWCGHCKAFKQDWDQLKNHQDVKNKINFVTMDADKNKKEITDWKIEGFPTLILKNGDTATEYNGKRTIPELIKFINTTI